MSDPNLNISLMAIVDAFGFRVQVMTFLDLEQGSLKVGSSDQCRSVPHGDLDDVERPVNADMCTVARRIGLAVHEIKVGTEKVQLGFGADVEAHLDKKGIGRVFDTARVFPPEDYVTTTWKKVEKAGRVLLPKELFTDRVVMATRKEKGKKKTLARATAVKLSTKEGKEGQWTVKFDKDGKSFARPVEEIHLVEVKKVARGNAPNAFLPSAPGNVSIYWRLLRPELLSMLKDWDYDDGLNEAGLSSDAFSLFAQHGSDRDKHDARLRVATKVMMNEQVPRVATALGVRAPESWRDGATLTTIFHKMGVNMRHAGAVWSKLNEKCKALRKDGKELGASEAGKRAEHLRKSYDYECARRGVVQEMFVRSAKNILRRDLRSAMEDGAGVLELRRIVSGTFTCITSGSDDAAGHLERIWNGVLERFGVSIITQIQRGGIDAVAAVLRISKAVGVRLTPTCETDLRAFGETSPPGASVSETSTPGAVSASPKAVDSTPDSETKSDDVGASMFRLDREGSAGAHELTSQFNDETKTTESVASETVAIPVAANGDSGGTAMGCQQCGANLKGVARGFGRKLGTVPKGFCNAKCLEVKTRLDNETKTFAAAKQAAVESVSQKRFAFSEADIERLEARVKFMDVDDYAQGQVLQERSQSDTMGHKDEERIRVLALCDNKFVSALATYGGDHFGIMENLPITIASTRLMQVSLMCKSAKTAPMHVREKTWKSRIEGVRAFETVAMLPSENFGARADIELCGGESKQRSEMTEDLDEAARSRVDAWIQFPNLSTVKMRWAVELYKMLYDARMPDVAWEGTKMHVLRSMESDAIEGSVGQVHRTGSFVSTQSQKKMLEQERQERQRQVMELLEELLKIDFYNDNLRRKVVKVFLNNHDWSQNPPSLVLYSFPTVMRLLAEAKWLELKKDDQICVGGLRSTIVQDKGGGVYKVRRIGIRTLFQALFRTRYFALRKYQMIGMFAFTVGTCACFGYSGQFMYRSTDWWQGETAGGFWVGAVWGCFLLISLMFTAFDIAEYFSQQTNKENDITDLKEQTTDFRGRGEGSKTDALKSVTSDQIENVKGVSEWMRQNTCKLTAVAAFEHPHIQNNAARIRGSALEGTGAVRDQRQAKKEKEAAAEAAEREANKLAILSARIVRLVTTNASGASDDVRDAFGRASKLRSIIDDGGGDEIRASRTRSIVDDLFIALQHAFRNMGKGNDIDTHFLQVRMKERVK